MMILIFLLLVVANAEYNRAGITYDSGSPLQCLITNSKSQYDNELKKYLSNIENMELNEAVTSSKILYYYCYIEGHANGGFCKTCNMLSNALRNNECHAYYLRSKLYDDEKTLGEFCRGKTCKNYGDFSNSIEYDKQTDTYTYKELIGYSKEGKVLNFRTAKYTTSKLKRIVDRIIEDKIEVLEKYSLKSPENEIQEKWQKTDLNEFGVTSIKKALKGIYQPHKKRSNPFFYTRKKIKKVNGNPTFVGNRGAGDIDESSRTLLEMLSFCKAPRKIGKCRDVDCFAMEMVRNEESVDRTLEVTEDQ